MEIIVVQNYEERFQIKEKKFKMKATATGTTPLQARNHQNELQYVSREQ
jgi:hypothetical protein